MSTTSKRAAIYDRISSEMQIDNHSLDAQERQCRKYAEDRGWEVVQVYTDKAISGTHDRRPQFQQMIADAKAGRLDVVIVYKLDRFARNVEHANKYMKILLAHSVTFVSITEGFDATTAMGKMQANMMATIAEWYSDNLSQEYKKGKRERAMKGLWNGDPPFGYQRTEDGRLAPDPHDAAGVALAFGDYATGAFSDGEIARRLNAAGYRTANKTGRRPFSKDTARDMLKNRFYLGQVSYKGEWFHGQHPGLVDPETFERALAARARQTKRRMTAHHSSRVYPLSGLLYCEGCGLRYRGGYNQHGRYYRKPAADYDVHCAYPTTVRTKVEQDLGEIIGSVTLPADWEAEILERLRMRHGEQDTGTETRADLEALLQRAAELYALGDWTRQKFLARREELQTRLAALRPVEFDELAKAGELLRDFRGLYASGSEEKQKRLLQAMLEKVFLEGDEICAIQPQRAIYQLMSLSSCGPDGIRTRDLGLDRAACLAATPRVQLVARA
jgi:DNA invertase Pin-like site-specific DNA recombinase